MSKNFNTPFPIVDKREADALDILTERYNKLTEPSKIARLGAKVGEQPVVQKIKNAGRNVGLNLSEKELYTQMMDIIGNGFKAVEEQAAKFSVSEAQIINKVNNNTTYDIEKLDEICLMRSYEIAKAVSSYKSQDTIIAAIEGGGTGAFGFWGLPFNLVLSTLLYFRAVQSVAMFYGYDVKNDSAELIIAGEVFTKALGSLSDDSDNASIITKIMVMSQANVIKQTAKKTWTDMAARGGIPLLLAQLRALAHKSAQKALQNTGKKGLENVIFKEAFEQIGRKLTLKTISKAVPIASAAIGALIDTAQMKRVLEYADIFYQKRFILEKESRIYQLIGEEDIVIEAEINDEEIIDIPFIEESR